MLDSTQIQKAVKLLIADQVIILPTDTIYGLSAIVSLENQQKINELKRRQFFQPIIVLFSRFQQIEDFVDLTEQTITYLKSPIPTTVVFAIRDDPKQTLALRLVKRKDLQKIIDEVGPIFSTSVNNHGGNPINDLKELTNFNKQIPVFYDEKAEAKPSRIYNSVTGEWMR